MNDKHYEHWLWLHRLDNIKYARVMRLWQSLYNCMPRGFGLSGLEFE